MALPPADRLVGRDDELSCLRDLVRAVRDGHGGSAWIQGEAGIGKSALLAAAVAEARRWGCRVFRAAADELSQRFPLQVLLDCLEVTGGTTDPARQAILALLRPATPDAPAVDPTPAATDDLLSLVDRLCAQPVVLVLDDLQWADEASLLVWQRLGRRVWQLPLVLLAAYRPVPRLPHLVRIRQQAADSGATVLTLRPLAPEPVDRMVASLAGASAVGPGLRGTVARAAGNPLYVREVVDALLRERLVRVEGGTVDLVRGDRHERVPPSLVAAISDRLGFLSAGTLAVLRTAALLDGEFPFADLTVVAGRPAVELAPLIDEALRAGVMVESGSQLTFRHGLIRQVLNDGTPAALRLALHRQAAGALREAGAPPERVAQQLLAWCRRAHGANDA